MQIEEPPELVQVEEPIVEPVVQPIVSPIVEEH